MTGTHDLGFFVLAGLLLNVTPGPDMAYIVARSAGGGFRHGAAAVLGITAGCIVHTLAAALGLSAVLATSATAFEIVKWIGALYLLYAGLRLVLGDMGTPDAERASGAPSMHMPSDASAQTVAPARIFREAVTINVLNPKVALFFLAFVPQFISDDAPAKAVAFLLLGTLFNFNSLFVNLPVALLASRAGRRLQARPQWLPWLRRATGGLFIVLAGRLAVASRD